MSGNAFKKELGIVNFQGHENICGLHKNSMEITKDRHISKRADCIIGVNASKGCTDLDPILKKWVRSGRWIEFEVRTSGYSFKFVGKGNSRLDLLNDKEIVLRKSDYTSSRTLAVNCSHSANDIPREVINNLQNPKARGMLVMRSLPQEKDSEFIWNLL